MTKIQFFRLFSQSFSVFNLLWLLPFQISLSAYIYFCQKIQWLLHFRWFCISCWLFRTPKRFDMLNIPNIRVTNAALLDFFSVCYLFDASIEQRNIPVFIITLLRSSRLFILFCLFDLVTLRFPQCLLFHHHIFGLQLWDNKYLFIYCTRRTLYVIYGEMSYRSSCITKACSIQTFGLLYLPSSSCVVYKPLVRNSTSLVTRSFQASRK